MAAAVSAAGTCRAIISHPLHPHRRQARSTCSALPSASGPGFCWRPPRKSTATPRCVAAPPAPAGRVVGAARASHPLSSPSPLTNAHPQVHPQPETYFGNVNPDGPRACYDEGKRIAETMCYAYQKQSGVEVRVIRIFNTFGPRMHIGDGRVVSNFIIQVRRAGL